MAHTSLNVAHDYRPLAFQAFLRSGLLEGLGTTSSWLEAVPSEVQANMYDEPRPHVLPSPELLQGAQQVPILWYRVLHIAIVPFTTNRPQNYMGN